MSGWAVVLGASAGTGAAVATHVARDPGLHVFGVRDVAFDVVDFAGGLEILRGLIERPVPPAADDHARTLLEERMRDPTPDAGATTGDECPFALQLVAHGGLAVLPTAL